ncbi:P-loop containing nucleoside triphosphate hydrolase protein [Gymnopilus junonius]|uniref:P-loop containing nucleoside triphosphate hydrolase protein n=1 Tax=Gymnopilus junonius TaxID=109634 RepID=A0A9P5N8Y7_GYMJU|nr:P-loop containing nucleoside triphosphate hydrolase protein [Gymnopilus junonius]
MASPILIAQQIFSALSNSNSNHIGCLNATATNATLHSAHSTALPISATSFISLLVSYSALQEWLKLLLFGGILESLRRLGLHLYYKIYGSFFITARFEEDDSSFDWMMLWLSKQPSWKNARDVEISTRSFGLNSNAVLIEGEEDDLTALLNRDRQLAYLPSEASVHHLWYKRHWVRVTRIIRQGYNNRREEVLEVCILSTNHRILNQLLLDAKKVYQTAQQNTISIYTSDSNNSWRHMASRPKRPLKSIVLDHGIKDLLIDDARDFLASKAWYAARGIPFRRGYLLYGVPGSGKTSIIHGLAGELGLDVYIVSLSRSLLDDTALNELISDLPEKCIALMEDIDAAFSQTLKRDLEKEDEEAAKDIKDEKDKPKALSTSKVSLSGLLNALDGVGAQEGRILFATTNKYSSLDPALCRPGRMDIHVHFKLASKYQARELYRCFYLPEEEEHADDDESPVIADSGYVSEEEKAARSSSSDEDTAFPIKSADFSGYSHHARAPKLSSAKVATLAAKFAGAIPEREFSMAALQGYLMAFKTRPYDAVRDAPEWVKKERAEMAKKMELSTSSEAVKENSET